MYVTNLLKFNSQLLRRVKCVWLWKFFIFLIEGFRPLYTHLEVMDFRKSNFSKRYNEKITTEPFECKQLLIYSNWASILHTMNVQRCEVLFANNVKTNMKVFGNVQWWVDENSSSLYQNSCNHLKQRKKWSIKSSSLSNFISASACNEKTYHAIISCRSQHLVMSVWLLDKYKRRGNRFVYV